MVEHVANLCRTDPLFGAYKLGAFVTNVHERLETINNLTL